AFEREVHHVTLDERGVGRGVTPGRVEQLRHEIDADDVPDEWCERKREGPGARARIQCVLVAVDRSKERTELLAHLLDLLPRMRGDTLRRRAEARADCVLVRHVSTTVRCARRGSETMPVTSS